MRASLLFVLGLPLVTGPAAAEPVSTATASVGTSSVAERRPLRTPDATTSTVARPAREKPDAIVGPGDSSGTIKKRGPQPRLDVVNPVLGGSQSGAAKAGLSKPPAGPLGPSGPSNTRVAWPDPRQDAGPTVATAQRRKPRRRRRATSGPRDAGVIAGPAESQSSDPASVAAGDSAFTPIAPPDAGVGPDAGTAAESGDRPVEPDSGWAQQVWERLGEVVSVFVPIEPLRSLTDPMLLAVMIVLSLLISAGAARVRPQLADQGLLPALLGFLHAAGRFVALALLLILLVRAAPSWLQPALPWVLLAAAAAVGWSARDVLPDFLAGAVLLGERRIRRGVWLDGPGFSGAVERLGARATWLRNALGHLVAVPNRQLLSHPVVMTNDGTVMHETKLQFTGARPLELRRALREAVATSPWVPLGGTIELSQDPHDPILWHVRVQLRRRADGARFDGELSGRAQAMLAGQPNLL